MLGQNAVHGVMAGFTAFSTGLCNNRIVYLPIKELIENSPRTVTAYGRTIERVLSITGQPEPPHQKAGSRVYEAGFDKGAEAEGVGNGL